MPSNDESIPICRITPRMLQTSKTIATLVLCFSLPDACAKEFHLAVSTDELAPSKNSCEANIVNNCTTSLSRVGDVLNSLQRTPHLLGDYDRVTVTLKHGLYEIRQPLAIKWRGADFGVSLNISAESTGSVRISGAFPLAKTGSYQDSRPGQGVADKGASTATVTSFALPSWHTPNAPSPRGFAFPPKPMSVEVFKGLRALPLAMWPNKGWTTIGSIDSEASTWRTTEHPPLIASKDKPARLWAHAFWNNDWSASAVEVEYDGREFRFVGEQPIYPPKSGQRVRLEGLMDFLDRTDEWVYDAPRGAIYTIAETVSGNNTAEFRIGISTGLIQVLDSSNMGINGLILEESLGDGVIIKNSHHIELRDVVIRNTGGAGITINGGSNCGVRNSEIYGTGQGGARIEGGDRVNLTAGNHFVERTTIEDYSRNVLTYGYGVSLSGVSNRINNSIIRRGNSGGILLEGNDHKVLNNIIENVVMVAGDAGAIYIGRDFTAQGSIILGNIILNIRPESPALEVKGVYLDDQASGILVQSNHFYNVQKAVFIGGGRDNSVISNRFFGDCPAILLDARGITWQSAATHQENGIFKQRLRAVPFQSKVWREKYPHLSNILNDEYGIPKRNLARGNYFSCDSPYFIESLARNGISVQNQDN